MTRWKAFGIHLAISAVLGACILGVLFFVWFPPPLFSVIGADRLGVLIIVIDVIVGPFLTLIVFNKAKKWLKFDLAVIALLQLGFLAYGLSFMLPYRPVFLVAAVDRFELVLAQDLSPADLRQGQAPQFRRLSWTGPVLAAAVLPEDLNERNELLFATMFEGGTDIHQLPRLYRPYAEHTESLMREARPLEWLIGRQPAVRPMIEDFIARRRLKLVDLWYLPLHARHVTLTIVLSERTGEPVGILPIDPYAAAR
jgi:hypothetical protein